MCNKIYLILQKTKSPKAPTALDLCINMQKKDKIKPEIKPSFVCVKILIVCNFPLVKNI